MTTQELCSFCGSVLTDEDSDDLCVTCEYDMACEHDIAMCSEDDE